MLHEILLILDLYWANILMLREILLILVLKVIKSETFSLSMFF